MRQENNHLILSATDLASFLSCAHCTNLDQLVAAGKLKKPDWDDPGLEALIQRGIEHEIDFLNHLNKQGLKGVKLDMDTSPAETHRLMKEGFDYIAQARLSNNGWRGYVDVLMKTDASSALGSWSYEVLDTKLARETRGGTILQLCLYSEMLAEAQGSLPEYAYVLTPNSEYQPEQYRLSEYGAYYRLIKAQLSEHILTDPGSRENYPEPVDKCDRCRWLMTCTKRLRKDDHLSFVAGISKSQRGVLKEQGVDTLADLAVVPIPLEFRPSRGSVESLERVREQARLQFEARNEERLIHELLPLVEDQGLYLLPAPSQGDIFFDIEGDSFVGTGGFEYLFGYSQLNDSGVLEYRSLRADSISEEKEVFKKFMDHVIQNWERHPDMHIYHFTTYEPAALKRLMGRYATREEELDRLLRAERFIDLHRVIKHTLRASVEKYSIKNIEPFFRYERKIPLREAGDAKYKTDIALELGSTLSEIDEAQLQTVIDYNRDDCDATYYLRNWLEDIRGDEIKKGQNIPRPEIKDSEPNEALGERLTRLRELGETLREGLPANVEDYAAEDRARWLLSHMLEFHRREEKSIWWEYFRLNEMDDEELLYENAAISGLSFQTRIETKPRGGVVDRYAFVQQEATIKAGDDLYADSARVGSVEDIDYGCLTIDISKSKRAAEDHVESAFAHKLIRSDVLVDSLIRLAESVLENGIEASSRFSAALALLKSGPPRLAGDKTLSAYRKEIPDPLTLAETLAVDLNETVLGVQGPPGTGKTHTGAHMIVSLVKAGKKVGITGPSHKAIRNLLDKAIEIASELGEEISCIQKTAPSDDPHPWITETQDNASVQNVITSSQGQVAAGTAWLWARQDMADSVDVLIIDEAGQFSLANSLAVSHAAESMVLLGDPQQLDQPMQGTHPDGVAVSGLHHLLRDHPTMPEDKGLFLGETWRMHPGICVYISEVFYEGKLHSRPELDNQLLIHKNYSKDAALWFFSVAHGGNQNSSSEEAVVVERLVNKLLNDGHWQDKDYRNQKLTTDDILVVTPYNAQVAEISRRLPHVRVGTVDKFQGQEAPVVIVSYATSSSEDAPRGMDFLYSLNRLNVAVSRARCACFVIASPELVKPVCRTPGQMRLANGLCHFIEMANG